MARTALRSCIEIVEAQARTYARSPEHDRLARVHFHVNNRLTTTAGKAFAGPGPRQGRIELSGSIFRDRDNTDEELMNTILHELAHIAAPNGAKHGPAWKSMARLLGCDATRCHTMECKARAPLQTFIFHCSVCGHRFDIQGRRIPNMKRKGHRGCAGSSLILEGLTM